MTQRIEILVVEENLSQSNQLKHILEQHQHIISVEHDARSALAAMRRHKPQIVISAVLLPQMDGYALCGEIKADENLKDIPVILLTSLSDTKDVIRGLACGADNFVTKPFDSELLLSRIEYIVHNQGLPSSSGTETGLEIILNGEKHSITPGRRQVVDLLISTYDAAVRQNRELLRVERELKVLNERLQIEVKVRTSELEVESSDRIVAEQALIKSEERLQQSQKMEAVGRLAGGVAHDFNNILTVIIGYSDMMLSTLDKGVTQYRYTEQIKLAGHRAASLTNQLLAFSRQQVVQPRILNINSIVAGTEKMLARLIGEDIELRASADMQLDRIKADQGQMEQIILNLAINARDAMPHGGSLFIQTSNTTLDESDKKEFPGLLPGPYIKLSIRDTGCGMDSDTLSRIFEPFFTTKEKGKGTGLGLSTVYGIVKQSGGQIRVDSEPGKGTTFDIFLPGVDEVDEPVRTGPSDSPAPHGDETILLVEDDDMVRVLAQHALQLDGYTVLAANRGGEALLCCLNHPGPIHLMLTDVVMPEMSGPELAKRLSSERPEMKVLFMSGYTDDTTILYGLRNKDIEFLQKPFTPYELACRVREVIESRVFCK